MKKFKQNLVKLIRYLKRSLRPTSENELKFKLKDRNFGHYRGTTVDRYLIEQEIKKFLAKKDLKSNHYSKSLEINNDMYTSTYLNQSDRYTLIYKKDSDITLNHKNIIGDLTKDVEKDCIEIFDWIIATQLLSFISNPTIAMVNLIKMLRSNGIIFGTEPFLMPISRYDNKRWGEYIRFTKKGLENILSKIQNIEYKVWPVGDEFSSVLCQLGYCVEDINKQLKIKNSETHYTLLAYSIKKIF